MSGYTALPAGRGREQTRLWDAHYRLIWDSATATTPAYQHVNTWVNATIDYPDGDRWVGQFYRCPEGVKRWAYEDLSYVTVWPNPCVGCSTDPLVTAWEAQTDG